MSLFRRFLSLQMILICTTGCFKVLFFSYLSRLFNKSYKTILQNDIRQRATKLMKTTQSNCSLSTQVHFSDIAEFGQRPYIYMSNHLSLLDIPLIYSLIPGRIRFIAKPSLFKLPIFGKAIQTAGVISIEHKNLYDYLKSIMLDKSAHTSIWIFPEGHRSKDGNLLNFKAGGFALARELQAVIIPVGIIGTHKILPAKSLMINPYHSTKLKVGHPIDCLHYQKPEQLMELIHTVRHAISNLAQDNCT